MIETKLQASQGLSGEKRHPPKSFSLSIFLCQYSTARSDDFGKLFDV